MQFITDLLPLGEKECVSILGSGGKTSLLWLLARKYAGEKTLVSTTTKMEFRASLPYDYVVTAEQDLSKFQPDKPGAYLIADFIQAGTKLSALPENLLAQLVPRFDQILLEADGSKQLPLKGWESFEPVVPPYTTVTVGILPISAVGKIASEECIHRLPIFSKLTGVQKGEPITLAHLAQAIAHTEGMMKKATGRKILLLNQADTPEDYINARELTAQLPKAFLNTLNCVIAGSIRNRQGEILWKS
jgi:probable selenium-dependent hydroxylase accessory protein YqeC